MRKLTEKEIQRVLDIAKDQQNLFGDRQEVAQLALYFHQRLAHLESLVREVEHYLDTGQDVSTHARLLRDIRHYYQSISSPNENEDEHFGLE